MKKHIIITLIAICYFNSSQSQVYPGVQLGGAYLFGLKPAATIGLNLKFAVNDQPFQIGFNYHTPMKYRSYDYLDALSGGGQKQIDYTARISFLEFHALYRYYLGDGEFGEDGLFLFGGGSLGFGRQKTILDPYDKTMWTYNGSINDFYFQPYVTIGIGYDKLLDNDHVIGGEFHLNLNSLNFNSRTGVQGDIQIPSFIAIKLTYSIMLGG